MEFQQFNKRYDAAKNLRRPIEDRLDDCYRLGLPGRPGFYSSDPDDPDDLYDETAVVALGEFASRLQENYTPNFTTWATLEAGKGVDPKDVPSVNRDLAEINDFLFERVFESNFSSEVFECYLDLGIAAGSMTVGLDRENGLQHHSIPLTQTYLEPGPHGAIGGAFFCSKMRADHVIATYPGAEPGKDFAKMVQDEPDKMVEVVDHYHRDFSRIDTEAYEHSVAVIDAKEMLVSETFTGRGSNGSLHMRFGKAAGEVYGRGPMMNILAAAKTTNTTVELILQNAAMQMIGMFHVDDDGIINPDTVRLEPGALVPRAMGSRGLESIQMGGNQFQIGDILLSDQRANIRRGLFNDMLRDPNKTPATAFELSERMNDLAGRLSSTFGRLHYEFGTPYLMRLVYLFEQTNDIEMPKLRGKDLKVVATSPMAALDRSRDVAALTRYHQITAGIYGPMAAMQYDPRKTMPWLRQNMGVKADLFISDDQVAQAIQSMTQQVTGDQNAGTGPQGQNGPPAGGGGGAR